MKRVFAWAAAHLVAACYLLALALWALWAFGSAGWDALGRATGRLAGEISLSPPCKARTSPSPTRASGCPPGPTPS